jgi:hypothetical protein
MLPAEVGSDQKSLASRRKIREGIGLTLDRAIERVCKQPPDTDGGK